jgi:hypothetical protein
LRGEGKGTRGTCGGGAQGVDIGPIRAEWKWVTHVGRLTHQLETAVQS